MQPELSETAAQVPKDLEARPAGRFHHIARSSAFEPGPFQEPVHPLTVFVVSKLLGFQVSRNVDVTKFLLLRKEAAEHHHRQRHAAYFLWRNCFTDRAKLSVGRRFL